MKLAVECKSPLLQKSLEVFLSSYLVPLKQSDIVIRDFQSDGDERTFYIGKNKDADLIKPFSKSALILALQKRYEEITPSTVKESLEYYRDDDEDSDEEEMDFSILEKRIDSLTREYQQNILKAVKAFYEK